MPLEETDIKVVDEELRHLTYKDITFLGATGRKIKSSNLILVDRNWFLYRQLKSCFELDRSKFSFKETKAEIEIVLINKERQLISNLYKILLRWSTEQEVVKNQMTKFWPQCLNGQLGVSLEEVYEIFSKYKNQGKLLQIVLQVVHNAPKISQMYKNVPYNCWKCGTEEGTFPHL